MCGCASTQARTNTPAVEYQRAPASRQPATSPIIKQIIEPAQSVVLASDTSVDTQAKAPAEKARAEQKSQADDDLWTEVRAGFELPARQSHQDVRRWTQHYASHQRFLNTALARAQPFVYHVLQQVEARDMPTELALLPIVESGYDATARSYAGASGLWQFMPGTARHMGLTRDWWYDGRNDVMASTHAALDYLDQLAARYHGDWLLALAAYNAGPGRVDAALARARARGQSASYWNLELPRETTDYVPKLLAVRRIMQAPEQFDFDWPRLDNTPRTRVVALPGQIEIAVAARMLDIPEQKLRDLNPGMRRWASGPDGDYTVLVPSAKAAAFRSRLARAAPDDLITRRGQYTVRRGDVLGAIANAYGVSVAALRDVNQLRGSRIAVGQRLQIPRSDTSDTPPTPARPSQRYVVQAGDNLWDIAHRYKIRVAALRRANPGIGSRLRPGQSIVLPGNARPAEPSHYVVKRGDSLWSIARGNDISVSDLCRWNRLGRKATLKPGRSLAIDGPAPLPDYYEVEPGDSLWTIASRFSMQVATLRSLNQMSTNSTIQPGQRLRLQPAISG